MAGALHVTVEPWGPDPDTFEAAAREAFRRSPVATAMEGDDARIVSLQPVDVGDDTEPPGRVRATLYDYRAEHALLVETSLDQDAAPVVRSSTRQPLPSPEEREAALAVLREDPQLGPELAAGRLVPYRAMPPIAGTERPDGKVERILTVGLQPARGDEGHEIVGVHLGRQEVVRFDDGAPPTALAAAGRCGAPNANQPTVMNRAGAARVTVTRDGQTLWRLVAVRPAASSGAVGSGVELRGVSYRGKRVLRRAHVPILNVRYDGDACGPYRDWQNEESRFQAQGPAVAPGFRLCPQPATTVLESGNDQGNFSGVAVYVDGEEVVLVSELEAGWYRYVSWWRLHADGTIRARFGFGAVDNSCVCETHHHHAYWRFDFDIAGAANDVVGEHNDPPLPGRTKNWHRLTHEIRRKRNPGRKRRWRVRNQVSGDGYVLIPGSDDGEADSYGVGDFWALRYRSNQIDDSAVATSTRAHLDSFVNGESLIGTNVVVWYVGHFSHKPEHEHDHVPGGGHIVGPTLKPYRW
jgi:hypothetical protein